MLAPAAMDAFQKAAVLLEALPALRRGRERGRCTVIKLGGSAMEDPAALQATLQDVAVLALAGLRPVLVHGGGKPIDRAMAAAGLEPRKVQGRRYTDDATLKLVVQVLCGEINADLVSRLRELGAPAVAAHSGPWQCLFGERLTLKGPDGKPVDLGRVGTVTRVASGILENLARYGQVPVVPSLAHDGKGKWLNVNADTAAAAVAAALQADRLLVLSDTPGVLRDRADEGSLVPHLDEDGVAALIADGTIDAGMIPKVESALDGLRAGVGEVHLLDGRVPHVLLAGLFGATPGTVLSRKRPARV
jgi:acetylglutamate kinase